MNLADVIIQNIVSTVFYIGGTLLVASISTSIIMWSDVRAMKKSLNAAHSKIRKLEGGCEEKRE